MDTNPNTIDHRLDQPGNDRTKHLIESNEKIGALYDLAIAEEKIVEKLNKIHAEKAQIIAQIQYADTVPYGAIKAVSTILDMTPNGVTKILKRYGLYRVNPEREITRAMAALTRGDTITPQAEQLLRDSGIDPDNVQTERSAQA